LILDAPRAATRFLTRIPVPGQDSTVEDLRNVAPWFPLVGLIIGCACVAVDRATQALPPEVANALILGTGVVISGALHLDALMDSVDGLSAEKRSERLELTRTSVHTGMGLLVGFTSLLLSWQSLNALEGSLRSSVLLLTPVIGRSCIVLLYRLAPIHMTAGSVTQSLRRSAASSTSVMILTLIAGATTFVLGPALTSLITISCGLCLAAMIRLAHHYGGFTGDHFGAVGIVGETLMLIVAAVALPSRWVM